LRWVKVVEVEADVAAALVVAAVRGRAGWAVPRPPDPAASASAPTAGTKCRMQWVSLAIRRSVPTAAHR
jgi:hypothetical protein